MQHIRRFLKPNNIVNDVDTFKMKTLTGEVIEQGLGDQDQDEWNVLLKRRQGGGYLRARACDLAENPAKRRVVVIVSLILVTTLMPRG